MFATAVVWSVDRVLDDGATYANSDIRTAE
jgi:hypothetical protein